jgi:hypothetical protein
MVDEEDLTRNLLIDRKNQSSGKEGSRVALLSPRQRFLIKEPDVLLAH